MRKCITTNTIHESLHDYNANNEQEVESAYLNDATVSKNKQEENNDSLDAQNKSVLNKFCDNDIRVSSQESSATSKNSLFPTFKTALELKNDKKIIKSSSNSNVNYLFDTNTLNDDNKNINVTETKSKVNKCTTHCNDRVDFERGNVKDDNLKNVESLKLNGFTCARKLHEENKIVSKSLDKKSRKSSQEVLRKDLKTKKPLCTTKTVYEQILSCAKLKTNAAVKEIIEPTPMNDKNDDSTNVIKDLIQSKTQSKRRCIDSFGNNTDTESSKKVKLDGETLPLGNTKNSIKEIAVDQKKDKIKDTKNEKMLSSIKNRKEEETLRNERGVTENSGTKILLEEEHRKTNRSKQHSSTIDKKVLVPADKAIQFKTAEILKSYLMKYYPSKRIPDRTTFSKTCREMHYTLLAQRIFGKVYFNKVAPSIYLKQST